MTKYLEFWTEDGGGKWHYYRSAESASAAYEESGRHQLNLNLDGWSLSQLQTLERVALDIINKPDSVTVTLTKPALRALHQLAASQCIAPALFNGEDGYGEDGNIIYGLEVDAMPLVSLRDNLSDVIPQDDPHAAHQIVQAIQQEVYDATAAANLAVVMGGSDSD